MALGVGERPLTIQPGVLLWIDYQPHRAALPLVNVSRFPTTSTVVILKVCR
jgi:hypothetical protein